MGFKKIGKPIPSGRLKQSGTRKMAQGGRPRKLRGGRGARGSRLPQGPGGSGVPGMPQQPVGAQYFEHNPPQGEGACYFTTIGYIDQCSGWNTECQTINEQFGFLPYTAPEEWINSCIYITNMDGIGATGRQVCIGLDQEWSGGWCPCADSLYPDQWQYTGGYCT